MEKKELLVNDYRKWLLYSFDSQGLESHYQLLKALKSGTSQGAITIHRSEMDGLIISHEAVSTELQLSKQDAVQLIKYLVDNYFHTENIDELMIEKRQQADKRKNHNFLEENTQFWEQDTSPYEVRPHPKERTYFTVQLVISILCYSVLAALIVYNLLNGKSFLIALLAAIPIFLFFWLINRIMHGLFIGIIRGNSIKVTQEQFPEIFQIVEAQAKRLKIERLPEIYIASGHFNAFVTEFSRAHLLMIYSEVIETALNGNYDVLKYVTAHELGHIKQKHLSKKFYLFPARFLPLLSLAYSRGCEYTCDRIGYDFSPKGSIEGVLIMTTGKEIHSKFNIDLHIKNATEGEGIWTWLSEKLLTHPHLYKRLVEIKKYSAYI